MDSLESLKGAKSEAENFGEKFSPFYYRQLFSDGLWTSSAWQWSKSSWFRYLAMSPTVSNALFLWTSIRESTSAFSTRPTTQDFHIFTIVD